MRGRYLTLLVLAAMALLALVEPALAQEPSGSWDNGEGLAGELNDKIVTAFGLGLVIFFPLVIVIANSILNVLEKRKQRRKSAALRRRAGW